MISGKQRYIGEEVGGGRRVLCVCHEREREIAASRGALRSVDVIVEEGGVRRGGWGVG